MTGGIPKDGTQVRTLPGAVTRNPTQILWLETEYYFKSARRHVFLGAQGLVIVKTGNDTVHYSNAVRILTEILLYL